MKDSFEKKKVPFFPILSLKGLVHFLLLLNTFYKWRSLFLVTMLGKPHLIVKWPSLLVLSGLEILVWMHLHGLAT